MSRCNRCEWRHDPDAEARPAEQLAAHATDAGHWLCPVCQRSLTETDPVHGCEHCLTQARELLAGIALMYAELPHHLGHLRGSLGPQTGRSGDGRPLPGGDVLVLLSDGSEGHAEDGATSRDTDPPSIAFELGWWAMAVMDDRDAPEELGSRAGTVVHRATGYLERHARWLANTSPGFAQLHADLARMHRSLERATARDLPVERLNADCFDCGAALVRQADPRSGLTGEDVTCRGCGRTYTPGEYRMALRAAWERVEEWVPLTQAARAAGLNVETVEKWAKRGLVTTSCPVEGGRKLVWWPDVQKRTRRSA